MRVALTLALLLALAAPAQAAPALAKLGDFDQPTYATSPPGDPSRVFITERTGRIRLLVDDKPAAAPFLDLSGTVQTDYQERGLLSMAFAPDYATSGRFYVYLTVTGAASLSGTDGEIEVREYHRSPADPNVAVPTGYRVLLAVPHTDDKNHDGGQLQFGPDGLLYAGTGDGGGANNQYHHSQDVNSLLGKLLRVDVNAASAAWQIVSVGLRNPWRFSFDRQTGQIVIADVGQDRFEEIDVGLAGNYGWPCLEGNTPDVSDPGCAAGGTAPPFLTHTHSGDGFCSITGGYVVRDPGLPTLDGRYLYGDYCKGDLRSVNLSDPASDAATGLNVGQLSSFGEDACGRILVLSLAGGVFRLVDGAPSACAAGPPPDTRPCKITLRVTGINSVRKRHSLTATLRTDENCTATVSASIKHVATFKAVKRKPLTAGRRAVLKLKLSTHGQAAVKRQLRRHKRLRVAVRVQATDAAGNVFKLARGVHIRG